MRVKTIKHTWELKENLMKHYASNPNPHNATKEREKRKEGKKKRLPLPLGGAPAPTTYGVPAID